jgi:hypothetical protein
MTGFQSSVVESAFADEFSAIFQLHQELREPHEDL